MTVSSNNPAARHPIGLTAYGLGEWAISNKDFIRVFVAFTIGSTLLTVLRACSRPLPRVINRPGPAGAPADSQPPTSPSPDDLSPDEPSPSV